jgi:Beta/Gamma crystallin
VTSSIIVVRGTWLFFAAKNCDLHGDELGPGKYGDFKKIGLKDNTLLSLRPK